MQLAAKVYQPAAAAATVALPASVAPGATFWIVKNAMADLYKKQLE